MQQRGSAEARKINKAQIIRIHTLKSKLKMSEDDYRDAVQNIHGFSMTSKDLSYAEAEELIKKLTERAIAAGVWRDYSGKKRWEHLAGRKGFATPPQLRMIEAMWAGVSYTHDRAGQQRALRKFLFRIVGVDAMEFIESKHVRKVVNAIKNIKRRHE